MRDLQEDLKICQEATEGPWYVHNPDDDYAMNAYLVSTTKDEPDPWCEPKDHEKVVAITLAQHPRLACLMDAKWEENAVFMCEARTGWPEAIHRALAAEARVRELEEAINKYLYDRDATTGVLRAVERKGLKPNGPTA